MLIKFHIMVMKIFQEFPFSHNDVSCLKSSRISLKASTHCVEQASALGFPFSEWTPRHLLCKYVFPCLDP